MGNIYHKPHRFKSYLSIALIMKRILLFVFITCFSFAAKAQQDSILVVIECDSAYRPFLEYAGEVSIGGDSKILPKYGYSFFLKKRTSFSAPLPLSEKKRFGLTLSFRVGNTAFMERIELTYSRKNYGNAKYNRETGNHTLLDSTKFGRKPIINISLPLECKYNESLTSNVCTSCYKNDSVSWIQHGMIRESPITGEIDMETDNFFNPYNNEFILPHRLGGCFYAHCHPHWYCHRCKREY